MELESFKSIFERDIDKLIKELSMYNTDVNLWRINKQIKNSGGNLFLHIIGNLNHFIGATLGNSGYIRDRDAEFAENNIPKHILQKQLEELKTMVYNTLNQLTPGDLDKKYPVNVFGYEMTTMYFLLHLIAHMNYHLGQINYHRRLLDR